MNKLLFTLSILSLLTIGGFLQYYKTNSVLRQSADIPDTLTDHDQALLKVSFSEIIIPTKGDLLSCLNKRQIQPCEYEQPFKQDKEDFDNAISIKSSCIQFYQVLAKMEKDYYEINSQLYYDCYYDSNILSIIRREKCINDYFRYITKCGEEYRPKTK